MIYKARGYCNMHYRRFLKHGDPNIDVGVGAKTNKIDFDIDENGCFICKSHCNNNRGYMLISHNNKIEYIHRLVYKECFGEIPKGLVVRHKCDNRKCINPEHLEIGTPQDNSNDMVIRNRSLKGSSSKNAKLNERDVRIIKNLLDKKKVVDIAKMFGVAPDTIGHIKAGRTWKHVD